MFKKSQKKAGEVKKRKDSAVKKKQKKTNIKNGKVCLDPEKIIMYIT